MGFHLTTKRGLPRCGMHRSCPSKPERRAGGPSSPTGANLLHAPAVMSFVDPVDPPPLDPSYLRNQPLKAVPQQL
jgi:hypothetical protein